MLLESATSYRTTFRGSRPRLASPEGFVGENTWKTCSSLPTKRCNFKISIYLSFLSARVHRGNEQGFSGNTLSDQGIP